MSLRERVVKRLKRDLIEKPVSTRGWVNAVIEACAQEGATWRDEREGHDKQTLRIASKVKYLRENYPRQAEFLEQVAEEDWT